MASVQVFSESPPAGVFDLLQSHLPSSITLLRRLQFAARFPGGTTPDARTILCSSSSEETLIPSSYQDAKDFIICYLDISRGPETQLFIYSSLEPAYTRLSQDQNGLLEEQVTRLMEEIMKITAIYKGSMVYGDCVMLGSVHTGIRRILEDMGRVRPRGPPYDKWIFKVDSLAQQDSELPAGLRWDGVNKTLEDCQLVVSRTHIPRLPKTLLEMPSMFIRTEDDTPIAWAFLGVEASLSSLHCEEPYRRQGLAKKLAAKLLGEQTQAYGDDSWSSADISADNLGSRGVCRALGGEPMWEVSWVMLDVSPSLPSLATGS